MGKTSWQLVVGEALRAALRVLLIALAGAASDAALLDGAVRDRVLAVLDASSFRSSAEAQEWQRHPYLSGINLRGLSAHGTNA